MKQTDINRLLQLLEKYCAENSSREATALMRTIQGIPKSPGKAGRKPKYSEETARTIQALRADGASIRSIAKITGCSVGYVQHHIKSTRSGESR